MRNLIFGIISLFLGLALIILSVAQGSLSLNLGLIVGVLLLLNGAVRLWLFTRTKPAGRGDKS